MTNMLRDQLGSTILVLLLTVLLLVPFVLYLKLNSPGEKPDD